MSVTLGKQLAETRAKLGYSPADISHATKIPTNAVLCLENDDYSEFPNFVYAKSFLRIYSKHLDVDASGYLSELESLTGTDEVRKGYLSGQFNDQEAREIVNWQHHFPIKPILTTIFFMLVGSAAAWFLSNQYLQYLERKNDPKIEGEGSLDEAVPAMIGGEAVQKAGGIDEMVPDRAEEAKAAPNPVAEESGPPIPVAMPVEEVDATSENSGELDPALPAILVETVSDEGLTTEDLGD